MSWALSWLSASRVALPNAALAKSSTTCCFRAQSWDMLTVLGFLSVYLRLCVYLCVVSVSLLRRLCVSVSVCLSVCVSL